MRILIIEDDQFFQNFYSVKLIEKGFEVYVARDGEEGLTKAQELKPNIILLDIIMPKKDGFEVLESIAKDEKLKNIPVIVFSTLGQEEDVVRAKSLGAVDYLNKSLFDFEELLNKINTCLAKSLPSSSSSS